MSIKKMNLGEAIEHCLDIVKQSELSTEIKKFNHIIDIVLNEYDDIH